MLSPATGDAYVIFTNSSIGVKSFRAITGAVFPGEHPIFHFRMLQPQE
jgi:hypothetical protein